jgi:hypothetical protein
MKKTVDIIRLTVTIISITVTISAMMLLLVLFSGTFVSNTVADEDSKVILKVGRYMHSSGDITKYLEVYADHTIQVFNRGLVEETMNHPSNKESLSKMCEEGIKLLIEDLQYQCDWLSKRNTYTYSAGGVLLGDSGFGLIVVDENTLMSGELNRYVYAGN